MRDTGPSFGFRRPTPVVAATLVTLVAAFVLVAFAVRFLPPFGPNLYRMLTLDPSRVLGGPWRLWTLLSYALLHDLSDPQHLLFNCLGLYMFGPDLEEVWGRSRFITFMLLAALGGGLAVLAAYGLGLAASPVVGASAVVMGAIVAWGLTFPDRELMLFFVLRMRGIYLVYVTIGFEVLNALSLSGVSATCHFGGMMVGAGYVLARGNGALRRAWLKWRLGRLQAQASGLRGSPQARHRSADRPFRVIEGGAARPPKDKRDLN